jgi:type VI secretion system (T6SS) Tli4-like immunity protein
MIAPAKWLTFLTLGAVFCVNSGTAALSLSDPGVPGKKKPERPQMQDPIEKNAPRVDCEGRFRFAVPGSFNVSGRSQSIYAVSVSTAALPPGGMDALWNARLARIRPPGASNASDQVVFRTFDLQPGSRAVWYARDPAAPRIRNLEAVMVSGNFAVLASRSGESGKESIVEDLVRLLLNDYAPSTAHGFCVGQGALTSPPSSDEESLISLSHKKSQDFQIKFSTRVVSRADKTTYSDVEEEREVAESGGGSISVIRDQSRSVAGLEGKEIEISVKVPGDPPFVRFTWHFAGAPQNSFKPMINIVGTAPLPQQAELQRFWDLFLQSMEPVPPSPQH